MKTIKTSLRSLALFSLTLTSTLVAQPAISFSTLHTFTGPEGAQPYAGLVQGSDGYFYGTTYSGGTSNGGTVFKINTTGALTSLYSFPVSTWVKAGLVEGTDGYYYGMTYQGGTNGNGSVFKIDTNGAEAPLYSFTNALGPGYTIPKATLIQASDGFFYGTTPGADNLQGDVFKVSTTGTFAELYKFSGSNGRNPEAAPLMQGSDGYLYGTTIFGGTNGTGTVFKISTNGALSTLYSFSNRNDGGYPYSGLVQASDGFLYGITTSGSTNGTGTVFKIGTNGAFSTLCCFPWSNPSNSVNYQAGLIQGSDGFFYGTSYLGGNYARGAVFQVSTNGALTVLYSFTGGNDGEHSQGTLLQASNGYFYGTTSFGGTNNGGAVFRFGLLPELQAALVSNTTLTLTWSAVPGASYQLQCSSDLSSTNWSNLGGVITASEITLSSTDSTTSAPCRFYRVLLLP